MHFEEPWQDIRGLDVQGEHVGTVEDLYVDRGARLARFLDVSDDGSSSGWARSACSWCL